MEYSIVNKSQIISDFRIDAECYKKNYLEINDILNKIPHSTIGDEVSIFSKGIFDINAKYYSDSGIPFVRISNLKNMMIDESYVYIPNEQNDINKKSFLSRDDIILSKTAYPAASLVTIAFCNTSQDTIAVKLNEHSKFKSHFLVLFLNSKYGYPQMQRWFTGNVQMHLNLSDSKNILIPIFSESFQENLKQCFKDAIFSIELSKLKYLESQSILLSELGLLDWKPKHNLSFAKKYSDTHQAERFDAEYFQPKYTELLKIIEKNSQYTCTISSIQNYNARGLQPIYNPDGALNVINSKHILETDLDYDNFERTNCSNWTDQKRGRVYTGDILTYTTGANIGRTAVYSSKKHALASNHVNILRIENENPKYVGFVMNSIIGRLQTERLSAGSAQAELYPKDIGSFIIPFIALDKQKEIIERTSQSRLMKHKSKYLLESAKKAVEMAIEKDEETAMQWLESQIANINEDY